MFLFDEHEELLEETVEPTNLGLDGLEGALIAVSESDNMYFNLCEKMMRLEHKAIITEDMELLQEGKASFGENVKSLFQKMKSYVEELFRKFMNWITKSLGTDKAILKRLNGKSGTVEIQGYKFKGYFNMCTKINSAINDALNLEKIYETDQVIPRIATKLGVSAKTSAELMSKIKEEMQDGLEKTKVEITTKQIEDILKNYQEQITHLQSIKNRLQKSFDLMIKAMNNSKEKGEATVDGINKHIFTSMYSYSSTNDTSLDKESLKKHNSRKGTGGIIIKNTRLTANVLMKAFGVSIDCAKSIRMQARAAAGKMMSSTSSEKVVGTV